MSGPNPETSANSSPAPLDQDWVEDELIPFLAHVFAEEHRTTHEWGRLVVFARHNLDRVPFYEDFPFTIERLRLTLLNSELLTPSEMSKFMRITEQGSQLCIRIFVRHAVRHGLYRLYSLGQGPSYQFPRPQPGTSGGQQNSTAQTAAPPTQPSAAALAQLAERNAVLEKQLASLSRRVDRAEGNRGNGRANARGRGNFSPWGRRAQPRGGFVGRSDRGHFNQRPPRADPVVQQMPSHFTLNPSQGYYQPPAGPQYPQYGYSDSYVPAPPMSSFGMQPSNNNSGPQYGGAWTGNHAMTYTTHQANSSQTESSIGFAMPGGQQVRAQEQTQGLSTHSQQSASGSGTNTYVPRPEAEEFTPGSDAYETDSTTLLTPPGSETTDE